MIINKVVLCWAIPLIRAMIKVFIHNKIYLFLYRKGPRTTPGVNHDNHVTEAYECYCFR